MVVVMDMTLAVATPGHCHESHEGVFFLIVMFCVQPCPRRCARPTSRLRSSSGNCGPVVRGCGTDKVQSQLWPVTSSSDANPSGCAAYSSDGITSGGLASSSGATNSYRPAFSCGVTTCLLLPRDRLYLISKKVLKTKLIKQIEPCYCIINSILRSTFISILNSCILIQHRKYSQCLQLEEYLVFCSP